MQDIPHKKIPKSLKLKNILKRCEKKSAINSLHVKEMWTKKKKRFQKIRLLKDKKEKKSKVCRSYQNIKALIHLQNSA